MRKIALIAVALLMLVCVSCSSKPKTSGNSFTASSQTDPRRDYSKPYLTDANVTNLIKSMNEEHNPFEVIFKQGGQINTVADMQSRMAEFNAYARKYGFQDYEDYMAVWGRVFVGQAQLWANDMKQGVEKMTRDNIDNAKKQLQDPNLSPDMRKIYEQQVTSGEKSLADMEKPGKNSLNDSDLALVKKYLPQLQEATKKYSQTAGKN